MARQLWFVAPAAPPYAPCEVANPPRLAMAEEITDGGATLVADAWWALLESTIEDAIKVRDSFAAATGFEYAIRTPRAGAYCGGSSATAYIDDNARVVEDARSVLASLQHDVDNEEDAQEYLLAANRQF